MSTRFQKHKARLLAIPLLLVLGLTWLLWPQKHIEAGWFDDSWLYRVAYDITNSGSAINAERKIKLDIDTATLITAGKLQSDCDDARFTDVNGDPLEYFIDTDSGACNTNSTDFYIKVPQVLAGKQTIYFYYGNSTAAQGRKNDFFAEDTTGQGLKAYYKMDEASANTCTGGTNDTCDYALTNDGAWNGDVASTTGKVGNGTTFDGDDYISITGPTSTSKSYTFSFWLNSSVASSTLDYLFDVSSGRLVIAHQTDTAGKIGWYDGSFHSVADTPLDGSWHHIVFVLNNGTSTGTIYQDGVSLGSAAYTGVDIGGTLRIGNVYDSTVYGYNGKLDDYRIYNRALTGSEISAIYNSGNGQSINVPLTFTQSATAAANEEKGPGPVAAWSFDEGTGTTAYDSTSNANNGTLTNGPAWRNESECIAGKCLYFDGADDYINASSFTTFSATEFTVAAWVRIAGDANGGVIVSKLGSASLTGWNLEYAANGALSFHVGKNAGSYNTWSASSSSGYNDNKWHYVVGSWKDSTYIRLSIDGQQVAETTSSIGTHTSNAVSVKMGILAYDTGPGSVWFSKMFIDEVRIYPYARTAAQIKADYATRGSVKGVGAQIGSDPKRTGEFLTNGLVAYYPMDEASANTCTGGTNDTCDRSGNGNDGAWNGDAASTAGKYGNGTTFDGTGDYINLGTSIGPGSGPTTLSVWANANNTASQQFILSSTSPCSGSSGHAQLYLDGNVWAAGVCGNGSATMSSNSITAGQWYHLVAVFESDSSRKFYINGTLIASNTATSTTSSSYTAIGSRPSGSSPFSGSLDEVRIYNRALTPAEVKALYEWAPGPVAHWKLDEKTGTSAQDTSGNGNTGTLTNGPTWTQGKYGSAVKFDGSDDYVTSPHVTTLAPKNITLSAWTYWNSLGASSTGVICKTQQANNDGWCLGKFSTGTKLRFYPYSSTGSYVETTTDIPTNQWVHYSAAYDGTTAKIYINGVLNNSASISSAILDSGQAVTIGRWYGTYNDYYFNGALDDVRIYNYALNSKQIMNVMNGRDVNDPAVGSPVGHPVAHWSFDEGYGTTAQNQSIHNNDGTLTNMASPATSTSGWSNSGKFGKALAFDGTNDYVSGGTGSSLNITNNISLSAWIYPTQTTGRQDIIYKLSAYTMGYIPNGNNANVCFYLWTVTPAQWDCTPTNSVPANQWSHIVATYDGTKKYLFVNGVLRASSSTTGSMASNINTLYIGAESTLTTRFSGLIDEVKIYNYALSEDEVKLEYNRGSGVVFGSTSTASNGTTPDNSSARKYCVPGDTATCSAPVAEWKLDDASGTSAQDTSGNANTGTLTNGPTWTRGKFGKGVSFDGSDDYIDAADSAIWDNSDSQTVTFWMRANSASNYDPIVARWDENDNKRVWAVALFADSKLYSYHSPDGSNSWNITSNTSINTGQWYHVAAVYDNSSSSSGKKIYINGILDSQGSYQNTTLYDTDRPVSLGRAARFGGGSAQYFDGLIDNVRIYNYARTPAQIAWEYNQGGPIAHYKFNECQGTTAFNTAIPADESAPAGNNGAITIGASGINTSAGTCTGSSGEAWKDGASGKFGASLEFDGSDDYVSVADTSVLDVASDMTISAWIKLNSSPANDVIVGKYGSAGQRSYMLYVANTNQVNMLVSGDGTNFSQTGPGSYNLTTGQWYHITGVYTASSSIKTYIDGKLMVSNTSSIPSSIFNSTTALEIGRATGYQNYFDGQIDDVRIYNYALTGKQIEIVYNEGSAVRFGPITGSP